MKSGRDLIQRGFCFLLAATAVRSAVVDPTVLDACPGYDAVNVKSSGSSLTAELSLLGQACNVFGTDVQTLKLQVDYETVSRIHVKITDPTSPRYEVPESVLPRPGGRLTDLSNSQIHFNYTTSPFSFTITRSRTSEILFSTASHPLIFEPQFLHVKTTLPANANIYGLGEHTDSFRLPTQNTTRTLWNRDSFGVPPGTNLYGSHPIYFEHRSTGTHGVFLLNSNGMDIKIDETGDGTQTTLEYNVIGGVLDFYFLAGSETDPTEVARQYAGLVGMPAEMPYWAFGLHQCRYGYKDFVDVAEVISNYSAAGIPLETMWTDIDYMFNRLIFTNDPQYFPTNRVRDIVNFLHSHDQKYILMTDPAVAYQPGAGYGAFDRGVEQDIFLKNPNGSLFLGVVWPGVTVFPDWFNENAQQFWNNEFGMFFDPQTGIDIDGAWIDMNEPSSFCDFPCTDPFESARSQGLPPNRTTAPPDPNTPIFGGSSKNSPQKVEPANRKRWPHVGKRHGKRQQAVLDGRDVLNPLYAIENEAGALSSRTANVTIVHANGLEMYDTHNLFGTMMSTATRTALLSRRPSLRPLVITRSTFAGAGAHVGKWLGDNLSRWEHYRFSIAGMLGMASIYQVPMVGSDVCGFGENTTETLCARWAMLGAFSPFYRNHDDIAAISQEFYLWPTVAQAARNAIDMRYRLLDYIYTAFHIAHTTGTPVLNPLWFKYPQDANTLGIDLQFLYGDSVLISPVTEENATSVDIYLPDDVFYDFNTREVVRGHGANVTLTNVNFTSIPVHIRGGTVLPLRIESAMTTTALRSKNFELVVAPNLNGTASGHLYVDDGVSISQAHGSVTDLTMAFKNGELDVSGTFGNFTANLQVAKISFLGVPTKPTDVAVDGRSVDGSNIEFDDQRKVLTVSLSARMDQGFEVKYS